MEYFVKANILEHGDHFVAIAHDYSVGYFRTLSAAKWWLEMDTMIHG